MIINCTVKELQEMLLLLKAKQEQKQSKKPEVNNEDFTKKMDEYFERKGEASFN